MASHKEINRCFVHVCEDICFLDQQDLLLGRVNRHAKIELNEII